MIEGLIARGIKPIVILPFYGDLCEELDNRKITYFFGFYCLAVFPSVNNFRNYLLFIPRLFRTLLVNSIALNKICKIVKIVKPNFIHTNVGPLHIGYYLSNRFGIPHFWHLREYQDLDFKMNPFFSMDSFKNKLKASNNYPIAITQGIFNYFSLADNARVISNGVYKANFIKLRLDKQKYFLFAGRLEENKGIKDLLLAFFEFAATNSEFQLYVAGDTDNINYKKTLQLMVEEFGNSDRVKFLGMRNDMSDLMTKATVLVVPSVYEGFGRVTVEAMFNGCLVIGNNSGGTKEILEKENLGILYSGHDELVTAMKTVVLKGIESYYPLIKKAQERAVTLYSQEQNVEDVYKFYQDILNQN
jgi:glycosyltransferase involved in cell wall biosynthesis